MMAKEALGLLLAAVQCCKGDCLLSSRVHTLKGKESERPRDSLEGKLAESKWEEGELWDCTYPVEGCVSNYKDSSEERRVF